MIIFLSLTNQIINTEIRKLNEIYYELYDQNDDYQNEIMKNFEKT